MTFVTGLTFGGDAWTPQFLSEIIKDKCLGWGRCFQACGRGVMALIVLNEDGEIIDEDEDDDEGERKVMVVVNAAKCIGCQAGDRVDGDTALTLMVQAPC